MAESVTIDWMTLAIAAFIVGPWLYALIDALSRPWRDWVAAHRNRPSWLLAIVFAPVVGASGYLIVCRPDLRTAART